jgi:hypothetical protein
MPFLRAIRDAVIKDRWLTRDDGRDWNAIMASGTEVQDDSYI